MNSLPICVITLDRAPERWASIEAGLKAEGLTPERFRAVDARADEHVGVSRYDQRAFEARRGLPLLPAQQAVFASHWLSWRQVLERGRSAVIMEDDAGVEPGFAEVVALAGDLIERYRLLRLSALQRGRRPRVLRDLGGGYRLVRHNKGPGGLQAYALSPAGAERLLQHSQRWIDTIDDFVDAYWRHGLPALAIAPYRIGHDDHGRSYTLSAPEPRRDPAAWIRRKMHRRAERLRAYLWLARNPPGRE